ncbi:MAG TPA: alpha/beta hydrolase, partial [Anaerolineales bacterium]|nr:alpha/beta hydrolase [Anaerolineales bacterium]
KMLLIKWGWKVPALFHLFRMLTTRKTIACMVFDHWFYKPADLPFESWAVDRSHAMNADIAHATFKAWKSINATNLTNDLEKLFIPVLVIFGERDGTVPVAQAHLFKERLPATQLVLIKDCGHFPMYETFDEYIKPLQLFLMQ